MKRIATLVVAGALALPASGPASAAFVYPAQGQTQQQQLQDENECAGFATNRTGHHPARSSNVGSGVAGGAAVGAATGAIIGGATGGKMGRGALIGGIGGSLIGGSRASRSDRNRDRNWNRAFAACMEGRGYSVR